MYYQIDNISTGTITTTTPVGEAWIHAGGFQINDNISWTWTCPTCGMPITNNSYRSCYQSQPALSQKPHCCPVCQGKGRVLFNPEHPHARGSSVEDWPCKPCAGSGIVWGF